MVGTLQATQFISSGMSRNFLEWFSVYSIPGDEKPNNIELLSLKVFPHIEYYLIYSPQYFLSFMPK